MKELVSSSGHSIVIDPENGGQIMSWRFKNKDIFFPQQEVEVGAEGKKELKTRGGLFVAYPHFGGPISKEEMNPAINCTEGMPKHGIMRDLKFTVFREDGDMLILRNVLKNDPHYGYDIFISVFFKIFDDGFEMRVNLKNNGKEYPPMNFAFHPYYAVREDNVGKTKFFHNGKKEAIDIGSFSAEECHGGLRRRITLGKNKPEGNRLTIKNLNGYDIEMETHGFENDNLMRNSNEENNFLWSDNPSRYFCLEPYLEEPERFGKDSGVWLPENEEAEFSCRFKLTETK